MFTDEQLQAINAEGKNILVSAGAGAGKTAVLTARVLRKLNAGTHINELLILTFTKAAASEMKDRIRSELLKNKMYEELNLLDSSYITTFDSYALSLVKKYHTKLNITNNINISDGAVIAILKKNILDKIFDKRYLSPKKSFMNLINDFCLKNDEELKKYILDIYSKIELIYEKEKYLNNYLEEFDKNINTYINDFNKLLLEKQNLIKKLISDLPNYFEDSFVVKVEEDLAGVVKASCYDEFIEAFSKKTSTTLPKNSDPEGKMIKTIIYDTVKEMRSLCIYESLEDLKNNLVSTRSNLEEIISILQEFDKCFESEKMLNEIFSYIDIARLSIKLVKDYEEIRNEVKKSFKEILLDEYQDTSDIQELFISLISDNNVYMVGDIKQSIYRFRNANPNLFKEKYETYDGSKGIKIDLSKNFRSREEVISDINLIFNKVMDTIYGGADYINSHQLSFGNTNYNKEKTNFDNHLEIITYSNELDITKDEEEAFIIANDIKNKLANNYKVLDKNTNTLRNAKYSDFVILLDRKKNFSLYKKIFEHLGIPLSIIEEENIREGEDLRIIRNLLRLLICIKEERFDLEFKYTFTSVSRSYLSKISDDEIYKYFINDNFKDSDLYKKCLELIPNMDKMNLSKYLLYVLDSFNYEEKILTKSNIKSFRIREEYIYNLCRNYEENGNDIYEFIDYLNELYENDYDLTFNINKSSNNSCKIMTIHKSKGLEYPVCYYGGLYSKFNSGELTSKILFDSKYGIVLPEVNGYYKNTILKELVKDNLSRENISERIRLFYVALTRAREKMIIVIPEIEEEEVSIYEKSKYNSNLSIIKSIYNILTPYIKSTDIIGNKDYLKLKDMTEIDKKDIKLNVEEVNINYNEILEKHYSKEELHLIESSEKHLLEYGTKVHEILEEIDFNNYNLDLYDIEDIVKDKINAFINSELMKDKLNLNMYKEYEFLYEDENNLSHGIIDLLVEDNQSMYIIDYKLKNIDDPMYDKQLNGYKNFISTKTNKSIRCFLYSILDEDYREVL